MTLNRAAIYGAMADKAERDPVSEFNGRATVPMGRGFGLWQRMNPGKALVSVFDMECRLLLRGRTGPPLSACNVDVTGR